MTAISGPNQQKEKIPSGYKKGKIQQMTPQQMQLLDQMMQMMGSDNFLMKLLGGDETAFEEIEAPQKRQFADLQGGIASKFSGMGMGGQKSSGFQNTMTSAASNFAQELGAQRHGLKTDAMKDLMNMSNMLMGQRPYENFLYEKNSGKAGWGGALSGAASGAGTGSSFGPWGTLLGGILGGAGGYFSKG